MDGSGWVWMTFNAPLSYLRSHIDYNKYSRGRAYPCSVFVSRYMKYNFYKEKRAGWMTQLPYHIYLISSSYCSINVVRNSMFVI